MGTSRVCKARQALLWNLVPGSALTPEPRSIGWCEIGQGCPPTNYGPASRVSIGHRIEQGYGLKEKLRRRPADKPRSRCAPNLHSSQILSLEMCERRLLGEESLKTICFDYLIFKIGSKREGCLRSWILVGVISSRMIPWIWASQSSRSPELRRESINLIARARFFD